MSYVDITQLAGLLAGSTFLQRQEAAAKARYVRQEHSRQGEANRRAKLEAVREASRLRKEQEKQNRQNLLDRARHQQATRSSFTPPPAPTLPAYNPNYYSDLVAITNQQVANSWDEFEYQESIRDQPIVHTPAYMQQKSQEHYKPTYFYPAPVTTRTEQTVVSQPNPIVRGLFTGYAGVLKTGNTSNTVNRAK